MRTGVVCPTDPERVDSNKTAQKYYILSDSELKLGTRGISTYLVIPRLVAMIRMGARSLSSARLRNEKHSMSNM